MSKYAHMHTHISTGAHEHMYQRTTTCMRARPHSSHINHTHTHFL